MVANTVDSNDIKSKFHLFKFNNRFIMENIYRLNNCYVCLMNILYNNINQSKPVKGLW
jgi:hypothetical protein